MRSPGAQQKCLPSGRRCSFPLCLTLDWGWGEVHTLHNIRGYSLVAVDLSQTDVFLSFSGLSALLKTNQFLEYFASRHQLPKCVSISYFWPFPPSQSSQQLDPAWLRCPELAEPSGILIILYYNFPTNLSPSLSREKLECSDWSDSSLYPQNPFQKSAQSRAQGLAFLCSS